MPAECRQNASTHRELDCHETVEENTLTAADDMMSPIMLASIMRRRHYDILRLTVCQRALPKLWCHRRLSFFTNDPSSSMLRAIFSWHFLSSD